MDVRDDLREMAAPFVAHGEQVQAVWAGHAGRHPRWAWITGLGILGTRRRIFVATARALIVLRPRRHDWAAPALAKRLPRATHFRPLEQTWTPQSVGGRTYWVHRQFADEVATAMQLAPRSGGPTHRKVE